MKLPWLTEDQKFAIGATIIFIGAAIVLATLTGCASVFDAPPPYDTQPVQYLDKNSKQPVICCYEHEGTAWLMNVPRNQCAGWTPI